MRYSFEFLYILDRVITSAEIFFIVEMYRKIPNIGPGLIELRKLFFGGLYLGGAYIRGGLYSGKLIFGGHFVLVSEYQDLKNHCFI